MEIRPHRIIERRKTKLIKVGKVSVGGDSKISVQSMTNTLTTDVKRVRVAKDGRTVGYSERLRRRTLH